MNFAPRENLRFVFLDFESYFDKEYTLRKLDPLRTSSTSGSMPIAWAWSKASPMRLH